jgi:hypothetical protein
MWEEGRQLTTDWQRRLELLESTAHPSVALDHDLLLSTLANEVLSMEMPTRIVATVLATRDRLRQQPECRPIIDNTLFCIQHVRLRLLKLVLEGDDRHSAIDRFRRRCERWTDLLIGPCMVRFGTATYAHDARRSWEFGEDLLMDTALDMSQQLVRPSLLAAFRGTAGKSPIQSEFGASFLLSLHALVPESIQSPRLQRWLRMPATLPSEPRLVERSPIPVEDEQDGWSLLDRCLRIVEWRRTHGQ